MADAPGSAPRVQWWIPLVGLLVTATGVTAGFGADIHHDTGEYARAAIADAGLDAEVEVDHTYRSVTLTGPGSLEADATAAVSAATLVTDVEYVDNGELSQAEEAAAEQARLEAEREAEIEALEQQAEAAFSGSASIGFESGSDVLTRESTGALDDIAAAIVALLDVDPTATVAIAGHTDSQGDDGLNLSLSQDRADAVRDYLIDAGVPGAALEATGYGETQPVASNDTASGRADNRRVEITLMED